MKKLLLVLFLWSFTCEAQTTFNWTGQDPFKGFWKTAINCGDRNQPGGPGNTQGSRITVLRTPEDPRVPGTGVVELWTNSSFEERCNQNFTAERAEISSYDAYRALGATNGATVYFGYSQKWIELDKTHQATAIQFRNRCGSGSPDVQMNMMEGGDQWRLEVRYLKPGENKETRQFDYFEAPEEGIWYDQIFEVHYDFTGGHVKFWRVRAGEPFSYGNPTAELVGVPTQRSPVDTCQHVRFGVYRWQSGDKKPNQIKSDDMEMIAHIGPVKIAVGDKNNLSLWNSVIPVSEDEIVFKREVIRYRQIVAYKDSTFEGNVQINDTFPFIFEQNTVYLPVTGTYRGQVTLKVPVYAIIEREVYILEE